MNSTQAPTAARAANSAHSAPALSVQPYVFFDGRCDEAIAFYRRVLGAEVTMLIRFKDSPDGASCGPASAEKVMHANLQIGGSTVLVSDGRCEGQPKFDGFSLSLTVPTVAEADRYFAGLADGGREIMPPAQTFFSPRFGMVADRFGVTWMVYTLPAANS